MNIISIYDKDKIKQIYNNIDNYFLVIITNCNVTIIFDKSIKKYKILNDIQYIDSTIELVHKDNINHYENELNIQNDIANSWWCNEIDIYKINDILKDNLKLYLNNEVDDALYNEECDDIRDTLELERQFFNATEEFTSIVNSKNINN